MLALFRCKLLACAGSKCCSPSGMLGPYFKGTIEAQARRLRYKLMKLLHHKRDVYPISRIESGNLLQQFSCTSI